MLSCVLECLAFCAYHILFIFAFYFRLFIVVKMCYNDILFFILNTIIFNLLSVISSLRVDERVPYSLTFDSTGICIGVKRYFRYLGINMKYPLNRE